MSMKDHHHCVVCLTTSCTDGHYDCCCCHVLLFCYLSMTVWLCCLTMTRYSDDHCNCDDYLFHVLWLPLPRVWQPLWLLFSSHLWILMTVMTVLYVLQLSTLVTIMSWLCRVLWLPLSHCMRCVTTTKCTDGHCDYCHCHMLWLPSYDCMCCVTTTKQANDHYDHRLCHVCDCATVLSADDHVR